MYKNRINKKLDNTQFVYSTMDKNNNEVREEPDIRGMKYDNVSIDRKINDIFSADDYIYKADVTIVTDKGTFKKRIIGKSGGNLLTFDNEKIRISDIRDIYR